MTSETIWTIVICAAIAAVAALAIISIIKDKKNGKSCSCGCSSCAMSGECHAAKNSDNKNKTPDGEDLDQASSSEANSEN